MALTQKTCQHIEAVHDLKPARAYVCDACEKIGGTWVHLRTCQTCGQTLCCNSSTNQHAQKHFEESGHPVIISAEPGEQWMWCYEDSVFIRY